MTPQNVLSLNNEQCFWGFKVDIGIRKYLVL